MSYSNGDDGNHYVSPGSTSQGGTGALGLKDKSRGRSLCLGRWGTGAMSGRSSEHADCGRPDTVSGIRTWSGSLTIPELPKWTKRLVPLTFDLTWRCRDKESRGRPKPTLQGLKTGSPRQEDGRSTGTWENEVEWWGPNWGARRWSRCSMSGSRGQDQDRGTNRCGPRGHGSWICLGTRRNSHPSLQRPVRQPGQRGQAFSDTLSVPPPHLHSKTLVFTKNKILPFFSGSFLSLLFGGGGSPPPPTHPHGGSLSNAAVMSLLRGFRNHVCSPAANENACRVRTSAATELIAGDCHNVKERHGPVG